MSFMELRVAITDESESLNNQSAISFYRHEALSLVAGPTSNKYVECQTYVKMTYLKGN